MNRIVFIISTLLLANAGFAYADTKGEVKPKSAKVKKQEVDEWTASHLGSIEKPAEKKKAGAPSKANKGDKQGSGK